MTIWIDIEDLVRHFDGGTRPTGIQRVNLELCRALYAQAINPRTLNGHESAMPNIRFCRHGKSQSGFIALHFPAVERAILAASASGGPQTLPFAMPPLPVQPRVKALIRELIPLPYQSSFRDIWRGGRQIGTGLKRLLVTAGGQIRHKRGARTQIAGRHCDLQYGPARLAPGDWLLNLGASWDIGYDKALLDRLQAGRVSFGLLIYDLIPELFPEWTGAYIAAPYQAWLREIVPAADALFAISHNTAADLRRCLGRLGHGIPVPIVLPMGDTKIEAVEPQFLQLQQPYILLVSTVEIRKNHALMFRVWLRLLGEMPAEQVPDLVFAGKIGWLVQDLLEQLKNTNLLNGKIKFIESPSEPQLAALYKNCLFTVFPSFYEGWGLPVTESLSFGKTVAASATSSIPEAGGEFCVYFDPNNLDDAFAVISRLIQEPARRIMLEARIAEQFKPKLWEDSAALLSAHLAEQEVPAFAALAAE